MPGTLFTNRLQTLFDTAPVKIWMSDEHGNYCGFNKRWLAFRGRVAEQEMNDGWKEGVHPDDLPVYETVYSNALRVKGAFQTELRLMRKDGEYRLMMMNGEPEFLNDTFIGFTGACIDITDRMKAHANIDRSTALLHETNAIAKVGGWEFDVLNNSITWTRELYRIHEIDPSQEITMDLACSCCHPDDQELVKRFFEKAIETGESFNEEFRIISPSQKVTWVSIHGEVIRENGQVTRVIGATRDITQQRNADQALMESEKRLHFVIDSLPVAVYLTDSTGHIINYNKRAEDLWGRKPVKDVDKWDGSHKLYTPSGALLVRGESPMALALKENKSIHAEELISECEKGTRTNIIAFATPFNNSEGQMEGSLNVLVDITERKQLEEKLISLSLVAQKTSNAVIISDSLGRIRWVNQGFTNISGYTLDEARGKTPEFLHCEETNKNTVADVLKALQNEQGIRFEILNKGKNGNKYWLDVDVQPLRDIRGNLSGFISVETDITEIKYIHEELKKSENKLRAILDSTSDDNILVDPDYRIISINKVARQHLQHAYGSEPVIGELIWNYVKEDIRVEFEQTFNQAVAGYMNKMERELEVKGKVKMWFEFCFYPVYSSDGGIIGVAINSKNIHAKKMAELKVQYQNEKLKEIAFTQSHTLRRPVANIMGLWNLINHDKMKHENAELHELMQYLGRSVNEMDEVIRKITGNTHNIKV